MLNTITTMQQKMVDEMFKRIVKGPGRDDMIIRSKKHFLDCVNGKKRFNEIHVFHWHLKNRWNSRQTNFKYQILFYDFEKNDFSGEFLAEDFNSWKETFEWLAQYLMDNEF